ncbi:uncharacterized protein LOC119558158 isoform X2 [Drosophila subpulchrella]|uniref:uncharacterized protein LOC119558158 isoform X2 n=1 Tax=Drosophila subpulchrella TaxID=1486046 RepID=UPI0018A19CF0|nr:uncharacterized protein LOC119558158 isoform X2 [Drosophila subpulchrella]
MSGAAWSASASASVPGICLCLANGPPASGDRLDDPAKKAPSVPRPWAIHGSNAADWRFVFYLQLIDARLPSGNNSHKKKKENVGKKVNAKIELDVVGWCPRPVGS